MLTAKETRVLELVCHGKTEKAIGAALFRSPCTIKNHVRRILAKLDAPNKPAAVAKWLAPERFGNSEPRL